MKVEQMVMLGRRHQPALTLGGPQAPVVDEALYLKKTKKNCWIMQNLQMFGKRNSKLDIRPILNTEPLVRGLFGEVA